MYRITITGAANPHDGTGRCVSLYCCALNLAVNTEQKHHRVYCAESVQAVNKPSSKFFNRCPNTEGQLCGVPNVIASFESICVHLLILFAFSLFRDFENLLVALKNPQHLHSSSRDIQLVHSAWSRVHRFGTSAVQVDRILTKHPYSKMFRPLQDIMTFADMSHCGSSDEISSGVIKNWSNCQD